MVTGKVGFQANNSSHVWGDPAPASIYHLFRFGTAILFATAYAGRSFPYWVATLVKVWNFISGVFFAAGIALAVAFMLSYLKPEPTVATQNSNLQEGTQIRVPAPGDLEKKGANIKAPPKPPPAKDQGSTRK